MAPSNDPHWEGSTNPRTTARVLELLAGLAGSFGLLAGLLLLTQDGLRLEGLLTGLGAVVVAGALYCVAVVLRWMSATYELAERHSD